MFLMLLLLMMTFSSCATLLSKKQTITVDSDVEGAAVYTGKKYRGVTPLTFKTKYTKTTLRELSHKYATILKKCALLNMGILLFSTYP